MKGVIRSYTNPKRPLVLAEVLLDPTDGTAKIVSDHQGLVDQLYQYGVTGRFGKKYFPADGADFIKSLPIHFKSAYTRGEVV